MIIQAKEMQDGQTAKIVSWGSHTDRLQGLEVTRVNDALFLELASWQDAFKKKSFLHDDEHTVELLA